MTSSKEQHDLAHLVIEKEEYDYSEDVNRDGCKHTRPKVHEIKDEWEKDLVDVTLECKGCNKIGLVKAKLDYDEEEVQWQE